MAINDNFYQPPPPKIEEEVPQECKDRAYWHKRFNFASWLFLFIALYGIFSSDNSGAAIFAIGFSIFWRAVDVVCDVRHFDWHIKHRGEPHV